MTANEALLKDWSAPIIVRESAEVRAEVLHTGSLSGLHSYTVDLEKLG